MMPRPTPMKYFPIKGKKRERKKLKSIHEEKKQRMPNRESSIVCRGIILSKVVKTPQLDAVQSAAHRTR